MRQKYFENTHPMFVDRGIPGHPAPVAQITQLGERGRKRLNRFFEVFDRRLADSKFVAGNEFSVADITALCAIDFAKFLAQVSIPEEHKHVLRWYAMISARPSAKM